MGNWSILDKCEAKLDVEMNCVFECDLEDGHEGLHQAWDEIPELNDYDPIGDDTIHEDRMPYLVSWPIERPASSLKPTEP